MKAIVTAIIAAFVLCSCATYQPSPELRPDIVSWNREHTKCITASAGRSNVQIYLRDASRRILADAQSGVKTESLPAGIRQSIRDVVWAPDGQAACVVEDFSDASSGKRYIWFSRTPKGNYTTRYLNPAPIRIPPPTAIEWVYPAVHSITKDTIAFETLKKKPVILPIDSVPVFAKPTTAS